MRGIVWGLTMEAAVKKLEEIENDYDKYDTAKVLTKRKSSSVYELLYTNGDYWIACRASESARGHKCNISYVDDRIDIDFVQDVIRHCTCLGPYQAYRYYFVGEKL